MYDYSPNEGVQSDIIITNVAPKYSEHRKTYVTQLQPQLDLEESIMQQQQRHQNPNKIFNPLLSSSRKRLKKLTSKSSSTFKSSVYAPSHLSEPSRRNESEAVNEDEEMSSPTRFNVVLPAEKSNPQIILKEKLDIEMMAKENNSNNNARLIMHEAKLKTTRKPDSRENYVTSNPPPSNVDFYGVPGNVKLFFILNRIKKCFINVVLFDERRFGFVKE